MEVISLSRALRCVLAAAVAFFSGLVHSQDCIPQYPCLPGVEIHTVDCSYCTGLDNIANANAAMDQILITDPAIASAVNGPAAVEIIGIDNTWATFESEPSGAYLEYDSGTDAGSGGLCRYTMHHAELKTLDRASYVRPVLFYRGDWAFWTAS